MSNIPTPLQLLALLLAVLVIGHDLYARRVSNMVLLDTLVVAAAWQVTGLLGWTPIAAPHLTESGLALGVGIVAMLPLYAIGWMGAGDIKLLAVIGFLLGLKPLLIVWLLANAMVGAQTILIFAMRFAIRRQPQLAMLQINWQQSAMHQWMERPRQGRRGMPFAAYLGIGVFVYVFCFPLPGVLS